MNTYEQELERIEKDAESKRIELSRKRNGIELMERTLPGVFDYYGHLHVIQGQCWATFETCEYGSIRGDKKDPDAHMLGELLRAFPPERMVKVKDGCTSFRVEEEQVEENVRRAEKGLPEKSEYECGGVVVRVETYQRQTVEFNWYARTNQTEGKARWMHISVKFPFYKTELGRLHMKAKYYGGHEDGKVASWERCDLSVDPKWDGQVVKWASGGAEYPNSFSVYWDRDTGGMLDYPSMIKTEKQASA